MREGEFVHQHVVVADHQQSNCVCMFVFVMRCDEMSTYGACIACRMNSLALRSAEFMRSFS
jgi:hypothetical protein